MIMLGCDCFGELHGVGESWIGSEEWVEFEQSSRDISGTKNTTKKVLLIGYLEDREEAVKCLYGR